QLNYLAARHSEPVAISRWMQDAAPSAVYRLLLSDLCDRFRLMFFGNVRQDWTDFVLAELGLYTYEKVDFSISSRAFQSRADIDAYLELHRCAQQLELDADALAVNAAVKAIPLQAYSS